MNRVLEVPNHFNSLALKGRLGAGMVAISNWIHRFD